MLGVVPDEATFFRFELDFNDKDTPKQIIDSEIKYQLEEGASTTEYDNTISIYPSKQLCLRDNSIDLSQLQDWSLTPQLHNQTNIISVSNTTSGSVSISYYS